VLVHWNRAVFAEMLEPFQMSDLLAFIERFISVLRVSWTIATKRVVV